MAEQYNGSYVRELCLKLKPILGAQMDQVFAAWCAEDKVGKEQIQKYLELAAAKYIPQKLEQVESDLIPPTREQAQGEYPLGTVHYAGKELFGFGLREDEWIQHVAVWYPAICADFKMSYLNHPHHHLQSNRWRTSIFESATGFNRL